jgi:hypothetical protein
MAGDGLVRDEQAAGHAPRLGVGEEGGVIEEGRPPQQRKVGEGEDMGVLGERRLPLFSPGWEGYGARVEVHDIIHVHSSPQSNLHQCTYRAVMEG